MKVSSFFLPIVLTFGLLITACQESQEGVDPCVTPPTIVISEVLNIVTDLRLGSVEVSGNGNSPLRYSLDGVNFQVQNKFSDLPMGAYTVTIQDGNGCTTALDFLVESDELVSYLDDIRPILLENCMIPSCHCDGNGLCFQTYAVVEEFATRIEARTAGRAMPPDYSGKSLTNDQIIKIANWVNQGARNN